MKANIRTIIRFIVFFICLFIIIYFQRTTGIKQLIYMLLGLAGILIVIFDYNYEFNHPKRE